MYISSQHQVFKDPFFDLTIYGLPKNLTVKIIFHVKKKYV